MSTTLATTGHHPIATTPPPDWQPAARRHRAGGGVLLGAATLLVFLGALAIRSNLVFGIVLVALIFVPMERIWSLHPQKVFRKGWRTDVVHFVVNNLLSTVGIVAAVVVVGSALHVLVPDAVRAGITAQPLWLQGVEAFLLAEVLQYWAHRTTHTVPVLWRFHKVHHSINELDWLAAARLHPVDQAFTRSCVVIPLFALGFTRGTFGALLVLFTFQALFIHANVRFTFGPLRYVFATPEFHHWHHAADPRAHHSNFAGELPLIDKVFGTLHLPEASGRRWPESYGLGGGGLGGGGLGGGGLGGAGINEAMPDGYLRQMAWPFRRSSRPAGSA